MNFPENFLGSTETAAYQVEGVDEDERAVHDYVDPEGDVDDEERVSYLDTEFRAALDAMDRGVDLRGYMAWSFLDNFEWAEGYSKRFGIDFVDYGTQRRIPKASALVLWGDPAQRPRRVEERRP